MKKPKILSLLILTLFLAWASFAVAENTADETVRASASDTTSGNLDSKLVGGAGINVDNLIPTGDQKLTISAKDKLTSKGDLLTHDASDDKTLAVGTDGQVLVVDSAAANGIKWADQTDLSAPGPIGDTTPSTGEFTELNATDNLKLQGLSYVMFAIELKNNSGTLQHRTKFLNGPANGTGGTDTFPSGVTGLSGTWNNTPTIGASTDFTAGVGVRGNSDYLLTLDNTVAQDGNPPFIYPQIVYNSTGYVYYVSSERTADAINGGSAKQRHNIHLTDINGANKSWNTTNIATGKSLVILVKGWVKN